MTEQSEWPKHPDGSNKRVGDMTPEESRAVFKAAGERVKAQFERPAVQAALDKVLKD
jgi:hypothetical protein